MGMKSVKCCQKNHNVLNVMILPNVIREGYGGNRWSWFAPLILSKARSRCLKFEHKALEREVHTVAPLLSSAQHEAVVNVYYCPFFDTTKVLAQSPPPKVCGEFPKLSNHPTIPAEETDWQLDTSS